MKNWSKQVWIFALIVLLLIFFILGNNSNDIKLQLPHAKPYQVYSQSNVYDGIEFSITANEANNFAATMDEFAQTVMLAVSELINKHSVNFVRVRLYENTYDYSQNADFLLAYADFDRKKDKWNVMSIKRRLTLEEQIIVASWQTHRKKFIEDGYLNESKLKKFLLKIFQKMDNITLKEYTDIKQIHLPRIEQNNNYKLFND